MNRLVALFAGLVFGLGLALSGMASPLRVLGFLDIAGHWDPSLAFVMGGALLVATPLFALARRRERVGIGEPLEAAPQLGIDRRLLGGAALFGIGWGLAGLCPGPALLDLAVQPIRALVFVIMMAAGLLISRR